MYQVWVEVENEEIGGEEREVEEVKGSPYTTMEEAREVLALLTGPGAVEDLMFVEWLRGLWGGEYERLREAWEESRLTGK